MENGTSKLQCICITQLMRYDTFFRMLFLVIPTLLIGLGGACPPSDHTEAYEL